MSSPTWALRFRNLQFRPISAKIPGCRSLPGTSMVALTGLMVVVLLPAGPQSMAKMDRHTRYLWDSSRSLHARWRRTGRRLTPGAHAPRKDVFK